IWWSVLARASISTLDEIEALASTDHQINISKELLDQINSFSSKSQNATSALTNLITCLICHATDGRIDPRFHRQPSNEMPPPPSGNDHWFSGRTISEKIIYPWLSKNDYRTAKSGWQTRTFERPRPYTLNYPENIAFLKQEFLFILDQVSTGKVASKDVLVQLIRLEKIIKRDRAVLQKAVAKNKIGNRILISDLIGLFEKHFSLPNSSILPVYAMYAVYQLLILEVKQYSRFKLKKLDAHESSDQRTGSIGDIELVDQDGDVVEALEIKHGFPIDLVIVLKAKEKIEKSKVKRYYILTTHDNHGVIDEAIQKIIESVYRNHGCQIIVNGLISTMKYYLRLLSQPSEVVNTYSLLIASQRSIKYDQIEHWSTLIRAISRTYNEG
ncbi:MAG: hypothetical protein AAF985_17550, partial [Bacteroidota bacterium]